LQVGASIEQPRLLGGKLVVRQRAGVWKGYQSFEQLELVT
jgi:hypothetical protein